MDGISSSSSFASGEEEEESAYDLIRRQNMIQNRDVFASLGFGDPYPGVDLGDSKTKKVLYLPPLFLSMYNFVHPFDKKKEISRCASAIQKRKMGKQIIYA
jgi:hypothetical protein